MTTRAVISLSEHRDYAFTAVLAALFWRDLVGHDPLIMLAETDDYWREKKKWCPVALDALAHHNFDYRFVGHVDGYETERIGQNARHWACCYEDLSEDDWLMYSDADLVPLKREFYHQHGAQSVALYYANGNHYSDYPTCHMTAQVKTWRRINGAGIGDPAVMLKSHLDAHLPPSHPPATNGFRRWMHDQEHASRRIDAWNPDKSELQMIERQGHPPVDRLCRSVPESWEKPLDGRWVDAHVDKAPDSARNWPHLRRLIAHYLPGELAWADAYQRDFRGSYVD